MKFSRKLFLLACMALFFMVGGRTGLHAQLGSNPPHLVFNMDNQGSGSTGTTHIRIRNSVDTSKALRFGMRPNASGYLFNEHNQRLDIGTNNTFQIRILPSGYVGVGELNPADRLHVDDYIRCNKLATGSTAAMSGEGLILGDAVGRLSGKLDFPGDAGKVLLGDGSFGLVPGDADWLQLDAAGSQTNLNPTSVGQDVYTQGQVQIGNGPFRHYGGSGTPKGSVFEVNRGAEMVFRHLTNVDNDWSDGEQFGATGHVNENLDGSDSLVQLQQLSFTDPMTGNVRVSISPYAIEEKGGSGPAASEEGNLAIRAQGHTTFWPGIQSADLEQARVGVNGIPASGTALYAGHTSAELGRAVHAVSEPKDGGNLSGRNYAGFFEAKDPLNHASGKINVAGHFEATGSVGTNYAIVVPGDGGNTGFGTVSPNDVVEIDGGIPTKSGLRLTQLGGVAPEASNGTVLSVRPDGTVYLVTDSTCCPSGGRNKVFGEEADGKIKALEERIERLEKLLAAVGKENLGEEMAVLLQNFPNPSNLETKIKYVVPAFQHSASIRVFDLHGNFIREFNISQAGSGQVVYDTAGLSNGVYMYSLIVDDREVASRKMIVSN